MFGKMMNNFYYGKSGKGDYHKEDLPQTRWQLFWEMLKIRLSGLCRLNLTYAVVWLPAMIVLFMAALQAYSALAGFAEMREAAQGTMTEAAAAESAAQLFQMLGVMVMQTLLVLIPCIAITGPFTAGIAYVTRNWARDEHAFVWADFRDAVKDNWKQGLAVSAITSIMPLMLYVCWTFYSDMSKQSVLFIVPQMISTMLAVFWMCSLLYQYPLMVTYQLRFRDLLRNGFLLTIGRLPMTVGFKLLSLLPAAIALVVAFFTPYMQIALIVLFAYYLLFGFSLSRFVGASYSNAVFDRIINPNIEGAEVGRGLYREEDEAFESDEEKTE